MNTNERSARVLSAFPMLAIELLILGGAAAAFAAGIPEESSGPIAAGSALLAVVVFVGVGFFVVQPNHTKVLVFFGRYVGTVHDSGFAQKNPLSCTVPT